MADQFGEDPQPCCNQQCIEGFQEHEACSVACDAGSGGDDSWEQKYVPISVTCNTFVPLTATEDTMQYILAKVDPKDLGPGGKAWGGRAWPHLKVTGEAPS